MDLETYLLKIGNNIKRIRTEKNLTQIALSNELMKDRQFLQRIEKGKTNLTFKTLLQISKSLNVDVVDLIR